jgi:hypothetical protein
MENNTINVAVRRYIDESVLCWLATSNSEGEPNVSPKEMFTYTDENTIIIANIASPNSINNIRQNDKVCASFVNVFIQKGYKIKGIAKIIEKTDATFAKKVKPLIDLFSDLYPIQSVIEIRIKTIDTLQAPSYFLFPDRTEKFQIKAAMETYKVKPV